MSRYFKLETKEATFFYKIQDGFLFMWIDEWFKLRGISRDPRSDWNKLHGVDSMIELSEEEVPIYLFGTSK